jgi:hypothetical protein
LSGGGASAHAISFDNNQGSGPSRNPTPIEDNSNGTGNSTPGSLGVGTHSTYGAGSSSGSSTGATTGIGSTSGTGTGATTGSTGAKSGTGSTAGNSTSTRGIGGSIGSTSHTQSNMSVTAISHNGNTTGTTTGTGTTTPTSGSGSTGAASSGHHAPCTAGHDRSDSCPPVGTSGGGQGSITTGTTNGSVKSMSASGNTGGGASIKPAICTTGYDANGVCRSGLTTGNQNHGPQAAACTGGKVRDGGGNCVYPACTVAGESRNAIGQCVCSGGVPPVQGHCGGKTPTTGTGSGTSPHLGSGNSTGGQTTLPVAGNGGAKPMISHASGGSSTSTQSSSGSQGSHSNPAPPNNNTHRR